jgi:hypothetical protein
LFFFVKTKRIVIFVKKVILTLGAGISQ